MEKPQLFTEEDYSVLKKGLWPVYRLTKGLSNKVVQKSVERCMYENGQISLFREYLPEDAIERFDLCPRKEAVAGIRLQYLQSRN